MFLILILAIVKLKKKLYLLWLFMLWCCLVHFTSVNWADLLRNEHHAVNACKSLIKVGLFGYAKFGHSSLVHGFLEDCGLGIWGPYVVGGVDWVWRNYGLWANHLRPNPMGRIRWVICYWFGKQLTYPISLSKAWII